MIETAQLRVLQACYSFLRPVARFLLRAGVTYRQFSEIARIAFVDVASDEFGIRGRRTNISRVSAMTGIARKEVSRLRLLVSDYAKDLRIEFSPLGDVLHYWCTNPDYLDEDGLPRRLPMSEGPLSFSTLVRSCVGDIPAGAVRVELLRSGAVEVDDGLLRLKRRYVVPEGSMEKLVSAISFSLTGLAETIAFNSDLQRTSPGRIERFVQSGPLDEDTVSEVRRLLRLEIEKYSEALDTRFSEYDLLAGKGAGRRVAVGIYYHEDANES